jgi:hypothetical protein
MEYAPFSEPKPSMTISIELEPNEEQALLEQARVSGHNLVVRH